MKNQIKNFLFPQKGKNKQVVRLYIVIIYIFLILGVLFSFYTNINSSFKQAYLLTVNDIDREFSLALLDPSITSDTVNVFVKARMSWSKRITKFNKYDTWYEYKLELINNIIPELAQENPHLSNNILKVKDITEKNIEKYRLARKEIHLNIYYIIMDIFIFIVLLIIPIFLFFRSIFYRVLLYIIYWENKKS